jgi:hypothetical protein
VPVAVIDAFLDQLAEAASAGEGSPELEALLDQARRNELSAGAIADRRKRLRPA